MSPETEREDLTEYDFKYISGNKASSALSRKETNNVKI